MKSLAPLGSIVPDDGRAHEPAAAWTTWEQITDALPMGWLPGPGVAARSGPDRAGGPTSAGVTVEFVFIHPSIGVALVDVEPHATPDAEARLRARLRAAHFHAVFPGHLPIVYR